MGVLLVVGGRLGDRYGRRRMFLVGIAGFTLASLTCGLAQDPTMLIAARIVQGGFGAMLIPQGIGILTATIPRDQQPRVFFAFGPVLGGAGVLGPILAGFIINLNIAGLDWRPIFLINIVLGTAGFLAAAKLLPRDRPNPREVIDGLGAALLGLAMLALLYGLIEGSTNGWSTEPLACLLAGVASFIAFAIRQRAATNPLILPTLLKNRGFTAGMLLGLLYFAVVAGLAYVVSVFLQTALHRSAGQAALGLSPMTLGIIIASFASRPAATILGRKLVFIGLALTLLGAVWMWTIVHVGGVSISQWDLAPALLVFGGGMGACMGSLYEIAVGDITAREAGSASGSLSAVQQLANAIGSATITTVYFTQIRHGGQAHAMTISLAIVAMIATACLGPAFLLPRTTNSALET